MPNSTRKATIKRLIKAAGQYQRQFVIGTAALVCASAANLSLPAVIRWAMSDAANSPAPITLFFILTGIFAVQCLCFYFRSYYFGLVGYQISTNLRKSAFARLLGQPIAFFDDHRVGDLVSRLTSDAQLVQDIISVRSSVVVRYLLQVIAGVALMAWLSLKLTVLLLILVPILVALSFKLAKNLKMASKAQQQKLGLVSAISEESILGIKIIKAFCQENKTEDSFDQAADGVLSAGKTRTAISAFFQSFVSFAMNTALVGVLLYGFSLFTAGQISYPDLTAFVLYGLIVGVSFSFLASGISDFTQAIAAVERIWELAEGNQEYLGPEEIGDSGSITSVISANDKVVALKDSSATLRFSSVSFSYPSRPESLILNDLSLEIVPGKLTALVGPSGAGKSTIVSLLLRFYEPTSGEIFLNNIDVRQLSLRELRSKIAYVPQEPTLFSGSLLNNLLSAADDTLGLDLIWSLLEQVNLADFVKSLPHGLDTEIGHQGIQLSLGQRQRIAIVRALLRDPQILVLDEATASLDSENEAAIKEITTAYARDRAVLVIAHRLSTIQAADRLIVLNRGRVIQEGTHFELAQVEGLYRELVKYQLIDGVDLSSHGQIK